MAEDHRRKQSPSPPPATATPRPSKVARFSPDTSADAAAVTVAAPPPPAVGEAKASAFTFMQTQELQYQVLIYKYMAAGVPVPLHLVLPIWKTVAAVSGGGLRYPTLMGWGGLCLDYRSCMEPEPGRCRRTDGKKWRCARDVVPEQKYCERHVHRGRNRSRKHVEGSCPGGGGGAAAVAAATNVSINASPPRTGKSPSSVLTGGC